MCDFIKYVFTLSTTVPSFKPKDTIPVQEGKPSESPKLKSKLTRWPKEKEPGLEVVKLKKVPVKPPEPEKQVVTHETEVTQHRDPELSVRGLYDREDREIVTLGRTEQIFTAEEKTVQLGQLEETEIVKVVQKTESEGWTRTLKLQTEEDIEVPSVVKKKITQLPKADQQKESVKLKPSEKHERPEPEPQNIKLKPVPSKPKVLEKEITTHTAEVSKHHDIELTAQKLRDREVLELRTLGKPERVFTAAEEAHELIQVDKLKQEEPEEDKSNWKRTIKEQPGKEPEPDVSKKKIKKLPKKNEEQDVVTLKPFERPQKQEAVEPKPKDKVQPKTKTEPPPFQRGEVLHKDQPHVALKGRKDADATQKSPDSTLDGSKVQQETVQQKKIDQIPKYGTAEKLHGEPKVTKPEKEKKPPVDTKMSSQFPGEKITKDTKKEELQKVEKTPSPTVSEEKAGDQKPIQQLKKVELKKTPSPEVDQPKILKIEKKPSPEKVKEPPKAVSPKTSTEALTLKKVPRKPIVEEVSEAEKPDTCRKPLVKEVSPSAVQMKRVTTQPEEEVFEEERDGEEAGDDEEAWGWELVPPEDWESEEVMGALETPGMPGARRGELETINCPN